MFDPFRGTPRDPYYTNYFNNSRYTPDELATMAGSPDERPFLYDLLTRARFGVGNNDFTGRYGNYISNNSNLLNVLFSLGSKLGLSGYSPTEGQTGFNTYANLFNSTFNTGVNNKDTIMGRGRDILGALLKGGDRAGSSVVPEEELQGALKALLSKYLPAEAVAYLFGGDNWNSLKMGYERQYGHQTDAPRFINYLQQMGYIPKGAYNENVQIPQPEPVKTEPKNDPAVTNRNPIDKPTPRDRPDDTFPRPGPTRPREEPFKPGPRKVGGFLGAM